MPTTDRKLRVFLCHSSQDKPIVRELYQRLLAEGWIDPWLDEEKLLPLFSPAFTGAKVNLTGMQKLLKARTNIPFEIGFQVNNVTLFLYLLTQKLSPKERNAFVKRMNLDKATVTAWQQLEAKAKKLEKEIKSPKLKKPSLIYKTLLPAVGDQVVFLLMNSSQRLVQDRIKNYLQKYLPMAQEVTDVEVLEATKIASTSPKFAKAKSDYVSKKLDARPKKIVEPEPQPIPAPLPMAGRGASAGRAAAAARR